MSSAEPTRTPLEALHALVLELFSAAEFRVWLRLGPYDAETLAELPGDSAPLAEVVEKMLGVLQRRGRIDAAFFEGMKARRSRKRAAIESVEALWLPRPTAPVANSQPTSDGAGAAASSLRNPFWVGGTMEAGHATYVRRACDQQLSEAVERAAFIAVEGSSQVGKSSVVRQIGGELGERRRFCHVDIDTLRRDHAQHFMDEFFERIGDRLKRPVRRWTDLVDGVAAPLVLVLDEFGHLSTELATLVVPALIGLDRDNPRRIQVIACLPVEPPGFVAFLRARGITADKHCDCWRSIHVQLFGDAEVEQLVAHLPDGAAGVARAELRTMVALSSGSPAAVQRVCSRLFNEACKGASSDELRALIQKREAYR
jgi:hypothetical protein